MGEPSTRGPDAPVPGADPIISVLVVDDDRWTTRAISHVLDADPGFATIESVHGGGEAVAAYQRHRPDVVLMDLNMPPGMSGIEATAAIRDLDPSARVVVLTTVAPGPGIARALEAGAVAVVNKTASDQTLRRVVRTAAASDDPTLLKRLASDILVSGDLLPEAPITTPRLTPAEYRILMLVCRGYGYAEIAAEQYVSEWTAKSHVKRLREKLAAENLAQLVVRALQFKFIGG